ncbi:protein prenylyltransferase [Exidia glandulosa HHB12029]|uniref:Protein farnesyltransferase/geranylgeranyltransferase type-1 subunit alpha n=1 Tax=Exidia glandulosa HHB12029 TaxID=1314781 RepID=A0A165K613_EXIGL|nr:protein prenylyltransferase [Exidia glandulosa HHB12029]
MATSLIPADPAATPQLYADNPAWRDVTPVPQDVGENPMAPIYYAAEYKDATDYFRGVVAVGEKSPRVLQLTERIIRLNPAHYTVWQYRWQTLLALNYDLAKETELMDELGVKFLKNYQVWHHRRLLVTKTNKPGPELTFSANVLQTDSKNYHTWAYRQWVLAHFEQPKLWNGELAFIEAMLEEDVRNNSAWHHRFFVVWDNGVRTGDENREDVIRRELSFAKEKIALAPNNESAWNYLRGVLNRTKTPYATLRKFVEPYTVAHPAEPTSDVVDLDNPRPAPGAELPCRLAIEFLADICEQAGGDEVPKALELYTALGSEHDKIRRHYWEYRSREAQKLIPAAA